MADLIGKVESNELLVEVEIIGTGPRGLPGPKGDPGDVTAESIREALGYTPADDATAMEYKVLGFNGSAFLDESGNALDFSTLHELCLDKKNFVYVSYSNRLYIPQYINTNNVWFEAAYIDNEVPYMHRLGINSRNAVNVYTKALAVKSDMDAAKESIATMESAVDELGANKADKSEIPEVPVTDVQVNGTSIVENGVANTPIASNSRIGLVMPNGGTFIINSATGNMVLKNATANDISNRANYIGITGASLDAAVKAAMCDGKGAVWTEAEQTAARERIGGASAQTVVELQREKANKESFEFTRISASALLPNMKCYAVKDNVQIEIPKGDATRQMDGFIEYSKDKSIINFSLKSLRFNAYEYGYNLLGSTPRTIDFGEIIPGFKPSKTIQMYSFAAMEGYGSDHHQSSIPAFGGDRTLEYNVDGHLYLRHYPWAVATESKPYMYTSFTIFQILFNP